MADTSAQPPSQVFYESTRGYRNFKSFILLIIVPAFAALPIWGTIAGVPRGQYGGGQYVFVAILSIAFIAGFVKLIYNIAANVRDTVRIDTQGVIVPGGRRFAWNEITAIRFDRAPFSRRGYLAAELDRQAGYFCSIRGQKSLSVEEAVRLLERIGEFLAKSHPGVKVLAPKIN